MLKLHAGVSKKVGLPVFSNASASCTIEAELDSTLLNETHGFQMVVRLAYQSREQAVQDAISRPLGHDGAHEATADHTTSSQSRIQDCAPSPVSRRSKPASDRRVISGHLPRAFRPTGHPTVLPPEDYCDGECDEDGDHRGDSIVAIGRTLVPCDRTTTWDPS